MDENDESLNGFGSALTSGVTHKVLKNAPAYMVKKYKDSIEAMKEKSREVSPSDFETEDEWISAVEKHLMGTSELRNYRDVCMSLMNILKVVVALEIVLTGEVSNG